ncbi:hypothetical protein PFLG_00203 [Plasmodium falciparum RAJ116]|uniref:Uncharacterized protein n=1 Tax=Plasmodium falciparum RAJ116 TaxID=580058 RepID=A0A0L0CV23_PLAFA|nr:hypothetical protein PFLG_00203 [Plasmodium falciparum RAJ116]
MYSRKFSLSILYLWFLLSPKWVKRKKVQDNKNKNKFWKLKNDNNVENVININNHNNILCKNKQIIKFAENEESNALNIHNLILNNLFVPQKNVYHIKKNNSFLLYKGKRKKSNFLYSMRNSYYTFLKKYMEYNNYMHKVKNTSLLSIGFCEKEGSLMASHSTFCGPDVSHSLRPTWGKHNQAGEACPVSKDAVSSSCVKRRPV